MRAKSLMWSIAMLLVLMVSMPTTAQDAPQIAHQAESQSQDRDANVPPTPLASAVVTGGSVKRVLSKTNVGANVQTNNTTTFVAVTNAQRVVTVPSGGDTFVITFSADCRLFTASIDSDDWVEVEIRDGSTTLATGRFCSGLNFSANSMQAAKTLRTQGSHTIKVYFRTREAGKPAVLGDWALTILQAE